jgi:hypothetical protein
VNVLLFKNPNTSLDNSSADTRASADFLDPRIPGLSHRPSF